MNNEKRDLAFVIILLIGVIFCVFMMSHDYIMYVSNKELFQLCDVRIKNMDYIGHDGDKWAYFDFQDENIIIEGKVMSNWWEQEGDVITIAYDEDYRFIRTQIIYLDSEIVLLIFCTFMGGVMLVRFLQKKKV